MLIDTARHDRGTKCKKCNTRYAISKVQDQHWFTGGIEETDALEVTDMKKAWQMEPTMLFASRFVEPVGITKYGATITVKSLRETKGEEERGMMRRKKE